MPKKILTTDLWASLKTWLKDASRDALYYDSAKIYEYVLAKMLLMEEKQQQLEK